MPSSSLLIFAFVILLAIFLPFGQCWKLGVRICENNRDVKSFAPCSCTKVEEIYDSVARCGYFTYFNTHFKCYCPTARAEIDETETFNNNTTLYNVTPNTKSNTAVITTLAVVCGILGVLFVMAMAAALFLWRRQQLATTAYSNMQH